VIWLRDLVRFGFRSPDTLSGEHDLGSADNSGRGDISFRPASQRLSHYLRANPSYTRPVATGNLAIASVTYPAPHGTDVVELFEGDVIAFGRSSDCGIRFGFAPVPDEGVPRIAGKFVVGNHRVFLEASDILGHRAIEVRTSSRSIQIPFGEGYSSREPRYDVLVRGTSTAWRLRVSVRTEETIQELTHPGDLPTMHFSIELSDFQWLVLRAYYEPIRLGKLEPATHREVATSLNYHPNTVREALYDTWSLFFEQGVPMLDVDDKRVAVVEAARVHGMLRE
jgi:hypothetical protein